MSETSRIRGSANSPRRNRVGGSLAEFGGIELQSQDSRLGEAAIDVVQLLFRRRRLFLAGLFRATEHFLTQGNDAPDVRALRQHAGALNRVAGLIDAARGGRRPAPAVWPAVAAASKPVVQADG